jgi:C4-dicarboxylate-specific signal transduction histidine kinase
VAARGSEIVRQLMIYSGTESGDVGLVDLSNIVDEMLSLLKVSVTKRAVIEAHLDRDLPAIHASAAQLRQIVLNLYHELLGCNRGSRWNDSCDHKACDPERGTGCALVHNFG